MEGLACARLSRWVALQTTLPLLVIKIHVLNFFSMCKDQSGWEVVSCLRLNVKADC